MARPTSFDRLAKDTDRLLAERDAAQATIASLNRALQAYGDGGIDGPSVRGFIDGALEEPKQVEQHAAGLAAALERERIVKAELRQARELVKRAERVLIEAELDNLPIGAAIAAFLAGQRAGAGGPSGG